MRIALNGEDAIVPDGATVAAAVEATGVDGSDGDRHGIAVAVDGEVVPRSRWDATTLADGQNVEVVAAIQGGAGEAMELGGRSWGSRLIVGTGGFRSLEQMEQALIASGTEIVTVALRRVDPHAEGSVLEVIDRAIQVHGGLGVTNDVPLAMLWGWHRAMRLFDGPDEVHLATLARAELGREPTLPV